MKILSKVITTLALAGMILPIPAATTGPGTYEVLANANGFSCEIPGCADASKNIREISIDELNIDIREMTTGLDVEYRLYSPGTPHYGNARFSVAAGSSASKELQAWYMEAAKGKDIRKNITVRLNKSDKSPGRSYSLFDCFPSQWSSVNFDTSSTVQTETLTVKIGRIELVTRAAPPPPGSTGGSQPANAKASDSDKFAQVRGFKVEITGQSGKEVDTAWESVSGGELIIELTEATIGADKFKTQSPGHKSIGEITLRGAMTDKRAALCQWINDTVTGKPWKRDMTITELLSRDSAIMQGRQYQGYWACPVRYKFPKLSVENRDGNFEEEITYRWLRWEPELPPRLLGIIDIPKAPVASSSALAIGIEDMGMDIHLLPTTGDARNLSALLVLPGGSGQEMAEWLKNVDAGIDDRRTLTIVLFKNKKPSGQVFVLHGCKPSRMSVTNTTGNVMEEVSIKFIRLELK